MRQTTVDNRTDAECQRMRQWHKHGDDQIRACGPARISGCFQTAGMDPSSETWPPSSPKNSLAFLGSEWK